MKLLNEIPVTECIPTYMAKSDKPLVSGIFNFMANRYTVTSNLCNKCGEHPKYPSQGLCKKCYFEKTHKKWVENRPPKILIPDFPNEEWKMIIGCDGYQISNYGRVKSLNYFGEEGRHRILKLRESRKGSYIKADIDKYDVRPSVHRLVAIHFIPNPENKPFVNHKDLNKQNNYFKNLEWCNRSENQLHYKKNSEPNRKLDKKFVIEIYNSNDSVQDLAIRYDTQTSNIWMIKNGVRWSSITGAINNDKRNKNA